MGNVEKLLDQVPSLCARGTAYPSGLLYPLLPLTLFPVPLTFKFCPRLLPCYQVELDFQYPSEGIHKRWDAGYRITCCGATRDQVRWLKLVARACSEWQDGDEWQGMGGELDGVGSGYRIICCGATRDQLCGLQAGAAGAVVVAGSDFPCLLLDVCSSMPYFLATGHLHPV